jgi:hypothetical protein
MSESKQYFWVVLCKNHRFHKQQNLFFGHKIPLGETDPYVPPPDLDDGVSVRCDQCGHEYQYAPDEVVRLELDPTDLDSFKPHPLFV